MRNYWGVSWETRLNVSVAENGIVVKGFRVTDIGLSTKGFDWMHHRFVGACLQGM